MRPPALRTFATYLRLVVRVLSWNIVALLGLGLILLAVGSNQGQELLRLSAEGRHPTWHALWTLAPPLVLLFCTVVLVGSITAAAGSRQLQVAYGPMLTPPQLLMATRHVIPCVLGVAAVSAVATSVHLLSWLIGLAVVAPGAYILARRFAPSRLRAQLRIPQAGRNATLVILLIAIGWCASLVRFPTYTREVGTVGVMIVAVSLWVNVLSLLFVALPLRYRLPSLVLLIPLLWLGSSLLHDPNVWPRRGLHATSVQGTGQRAALPQSVLKALAAWLPQLERVDSKGPIPVYLVSAEGGGLRAAYWTGRVLAEINERSIGHLSSHAFVYSGVSGGSLGIATFQNAASPVRDPRDATRFVEEFLGRDDLAPLVSRLLITEPIWQLVGHASSLIPRDVAFERQFDADWRAVCGSDFYSQPFNRVYAIDPAHPSPIMAFNATNVESGKRVIIANAAPTGLNTDYLLPLQIDGVRELLQDMSVAEAVHLSARFPYVSPPASLQLIVPGISPNRTVVRRWGRAVDGGYYDNSAGLFVHDVFEELVLLRAYARRHQGVRQAGVDWERLRPLVARLRFQVVVIRNDPEAAWGYQMNDYPSIKSAAATQRLYPLDLTAAIKDGLSARLIPGVPRLSELLAPPETMISTRDARGAATRRSLWETVSRASDDLSYQCEIERRVATGQLIALPLQYSAACIEDVDDYAEISLADAALENHAAPSATNRCGFFPAADIALGWTLSRESRDLMSCLARTSKAIRDIASQLVEPKVATVWYAREHLQP